MTETAPFLDYVDVALDAQGAFAAIATLRAELDRADRLNENLRQMLKNVQSVREHEFQRASAALARVAKLEAALETLRRDYLCDPETDADAALYGDVSALIEAALADKGAM